MTPQLLYVSNVEDARLLRPFYCLAHTRAEIKIQVQQRHNMYHAHNHHCRNNKEGNMHKQYGI